MSGDYNRTPFGTKIPSEALSRPSSGRGNDEQQIDSGENLKLMGKVGAGFIGVILLATTFLKSTNSEPSVPDAANQSNQSAQLHKIEPDLRP